MHWHTRPQQQRPFPIPGPPRPPPGPYGAHPGQSGQAQHYYHNHPQRPTNPPPSTGPYTLLLRPTSKQVNAPETLTPNDRSTPLFTLHHKPHSFSSHPSLRLTQHASPNTEIGTAQLHHFSSRVDLTPSTGAPLQYKSGSPLPAGAVPRGESWTWKVDKASSGDKGPYVARLFVTGGSHTAERDHVAMKRQSGGGGGLFGRGKKVEEGKVMTVVVLEGSLTEGVVELHRKGLERGQFELVVLTAVVQLEEMRRRVKAERTGKGSHGGAIPTTGGGSGGDCH
jgi:hypothetical protein